MRRGLFVLLSLLLCTSSFFSAQTFTDSKFSSETVVDLTDFTPVGMAFAPDGRLFIWQKAGTIRIFKNGELLATPFLDIRARVNRWSDRGLIGFAFDPDFATNGFVYVAYTYEPGTANTEATPRVGRLSRFTVDPTNPDVALANSERIILGSVTDPTCSGINQDCIPNDIGAHTVDHIAFGADGKLYFSLGDGASWKFTDPASFRSQDLRHLNGKVLRLNKDGSAPPDNPFYDGPNSNQSKVYAYGLRNPFRFTIKPGTNELYIGDVGWKRYEELNRGRGKNFGWPCWEGNEPEPEYQPAFPDRCASVPASAVEHPLYFYFRGGAITAGPFYQGDKYPSEYRNTMFFADYNGDFMRRAIFDVNGNFLRAEEFATGLGGPTHIIEGPDGYVYYTKFSEGKIMRIKYSSTTNTAPVAEIAATPTTGYSPLTVQFSSAGSSDADGDTLTYSWSFGDGNTSVLANPTHTYISTTVQTFTATVTVSDGKGGTASKSINITVGSTAPTATITAPADGTLYRPGQIVNFTGTASDPDEQLPASAMNWDVLLHHREHIHTVTDVTGSGGSFEVTAHDSGGEYFYEILLTVRDSSGLEDRKSVRINIDQPAAECPTSSTVGVNICLPSNGSTVTSPVRILASATVPTGRVVTGFRAYIDGVATLYSQSNLLDGTAPITDGTHKIVAKAWDNMGATYSATITVTAGSGGAHCAKPASGVNICSPTNGSSVTSPVHISAVAGGPETITGMRVYVDGVDSFRSASDTVHTDLPMASGTRRILIKAWDRLGGKYASEVTVNVGGTGPPPCAAPSAGVVICTPSNGATVNSPVRVQAVAGSSKAITGMRVYINGVDSFRSTTNTVDTTFTLPAGSHSIVVKAWDAAGVMYRQDIRVTVQ